MAGRPPPTHDPGRAHPACPARSEKPRLLVTVDAEAEFDWSGPFRRTPTAVRSMRQQHLAQAIFNRFGVRPAYLVDFAVATDPAAGAVLRGFLAGGRCEVGAHLNPWITPPFEEPLTAANSYPGNLPEALERRKLERLTRAIEDNLAVTPRAYRAGRFGVGPNTARILTDLGYEVDLSVVPYTSFRDAGGGPDFTACDWRPAFAAGGEDRRLLRLPVTCGFAGWLARHGSALYPALHRRLPRALRLVGAAQRLGLLERIRLTPEGNPLAALRRLTRSLLRQGCRLFCLTYHSPSLAPGNTPYVRTAAERDALLATIEGYLGFMLNHLGGEATTPAEVYRTLTGDAGATVPTAAEEVGDRPVGTRRGP